MFDKLSGKSQVAAVHRALDPVLVELRRYVYPLLIEGRGRRPELIASGQFISIDGDTYLITAAHAMRNFQGAKVIGTRNGKTFVPLSGEVAHTGFGENKDVIDLAAMRLSDQFVKEHQLKVVPSNLLSTCVRITNPQNRAVIGFPLSKNKVLFNPATSDFREYVYSYIGFGTCDVNYSLFEKSISDHIAMEYGPGNNASGDPIANLIHPRGMSGGGAWVIPDLNRPSLYFLEGVFIELHQQSGRKFTFSTRIEHVIEFIRFMNRKGTWS